MDLAELEHLPVEQRLALAYTSAALRPRLSVFFALDRRLGQIAAKTTEPMLGQMRITWWREILSKPQTDRPTGDLVLDAIGESWAGAEQGLLPLIDAWEVFVTAEALEADTMLQYASGRSKPFLAMLERSGDVDTHRAEIAGVRWALADTVARVSDLQERDQLVRLAKSQTGPQERLNHSLRGLAVLEALAIRALKRGGRPLMEGRSAALVALRAGIIGR